MKKTITTTLLAIVVCVCMVFGFSGCKKNCNHSYDNACDAICNECGETREPTHTPEEDDGDCTTAITCQHCDTVMTAGKATHTAEADDGNCTTAIKCVNCDQNAVSKYDSHNDNDGDYDCDNPGCQVSVGAPKDDNDGIDLPIDRN